MAWTYIFNYPHFLLRRTPISVWIAKKAVAIILNSHGLWPVRYMSTISILLSSHQSPQYYTILPSSALATWRKHTSPNLGIANWLLLTHSTREQGRSHISITCLSWSVLGTRKTSPPKKKQHKPRNPSVLLISPSVTNHHQQKSPMAFTDKPFFPDYTETSLLRPTLFVILFTDTPIIQETNRKPLPTTSLRSVSSSEIPSII